MTPAIIPVSIKKEGVIREMYCPVCKRLSLHQIKFKRDNKARGEIVFDASCWDCFYISQDSASVAAMLPGVEVKPYYIFERTHTYDRWNALITKNL